ncbi:unnamed protein product [Calypogeia fissa]
MRSAIGGCPKAKRQLEEDTCGRELHKAETGNRPDNYNKTDKQKEAPIVKTLRLATVTMHKWMARLKSRCRRNWEAQPQEPNPPRRQPCFVMWFLLVPVVLLALVGFLPLGRLIRPRVNQRNEMDILLKRYGFLGNKTRVGDTLVPTSWEEMHSPLGHDVFKLKRAVQILNCSSEFKPPNTTRDMLLPASNKRRTNIRDINYRYPEECPSYFNWIREDLAPWKESGISRINLDVGQKHTSFRATILKGLLYIDIYGECHQSRLLFTVWGLLLLLEKYKNKIPDVEFMFNCLDKPRARIDTAMSIPVFSYCSSRDYYDIPWPDWSYWGWPELQIESWDQEFDKISKGSKKQAWKTKHNRAYWRGNPYVEVKKEPDLEVPINFREQLPVCSNTTDNFKVDVMIQDWYKELNMAKKNSRLENQCTHRYMLYVEGVAWSVSLKYIMACGSPTMVISPDYYDFYQRGLQFGVHYIPVQPNASCISKLCDKLNEVVDQAEWNLLRGEKIGQQGQDFVQKELGMDKVYDYMYHVLVKYAQLQEFQPQVSNTAHLVTQDYLLCLAEPISKLLLTQARKHMPSSKTPCTMSPQRARFFKDYGWEAYRHVNKSC